MYKLTRLIDETNIPIRLIIYIGSRHFVKTTGVRANHSISKLSPGESATVPDLRGTSDNAETDFSYDSRVS